MAQQSKNERRKQKKQRDQKRTAMLRASRQQTAAKHPQTAQSQLPAEPSRRLDLPSSFQLPPKLKAILESQSPGAATRQQPERANTPIDDWWEKYEAADGKERLRMTREKLETVQPDDEWYEAIVPEAISELEGPLSEAEYVAFLEELHMTRPDVFAESADWNVRSMAYFYVAEERWEDLDRVIVRFADEMTETSEAFYSLMSLVRLVGRAGPTQRLIDATISLKTFAELMSWAVNTLIEWALFTRFQACVQAGATDEAIDQLYRHSLEIGCEDSKRARKDQRDFVLHLAGKCEPWTRDELIKDDRHTGNRIYLLTADFMRWLCQSRNFEPLVADELRRILVSTIENLECHPTTIFRDLRRADLEPAVARKLAFMSLDTSHAPAGVIVFQHFYDFLAEHELIDPGTSKSAHSVCHALWKELKRTMKDEWRHYKFLEAYLPRTEW